MKKVILLLVLTFCGIISPFYQAHATEEEKGWVSKADLPEPRSHAATAVVGNEIYVIGGFGKNRSATNTTLVYDSQKDTWSKKADMPINLAGSAVAVVKEKIYVMGGNKTNTDSNHNSSKLLIYDTKTDTWEEGGDVPKKSYLGTAVAIDNTIYLITQQDTSTPRHFAYDTLSKTWTNKANQPTNARAAASAVVNGKIYYIGGGSNGGGKNIYEYNPSSDSWQRKADLINPLWYTSAAVSDGKIYIVGGFLSASTTVSNNVQVYDPASDKVSIMEEKIQHARAGAGTVSINNELYTVGGAPKSNTQSNAFNSLEKYTITETVNTPNPGANDGNKTKPDDETVSDEGEALLVITMINGLQKEYQLPMKEVNSFLKWYKQRDAGEGPGFYEIDEHDNNKGPFESKKDYVVFNNILMYEVNKYKN
ncbi:MAG: Kelch repeat-containing protein [Bacillota bacterium]